MDEALKTIEMSKERLFAAEVNRVAGDIALLGPESDISNAETRFAQALAIARNQQARSWELRASTSLARLWLERGQRKKGCELLLPVYNWFTDGFQTGDLQEAKTLVEQLR